MIAAIFEVLSIWAIFPLNAGNGRAGLGRIINEWTKIA